MKYHESIIAEVNSLDEFDKLLMYIRHRVSMNYICASVSPNHASFLELQGVMVKGYDEFKNPSCNEITDFGERWEENGRANRFHYNLSGIYAFFDKKIRASI